MISADRIPIYLNGRTDKYICLGPTLERTDKDLITAYFKENNIRYALNVASECQFPYEHLPHITYKKISLDDGLQENLLPYIDEAHAFLDFALANGSSVYLNCVMGVSRSVSILTSYIMKVNDCKFIDALNHIIKIRYVARPNHNFANQLMTYQLNLTNKLINPLAINQLAINQ